MISTKTASFLAHFHCASYGNAGNQQISESVRRIVIVIVVVCRMEALGAKVIEDERGWALFRSVHDPGRHRAVQILLQILEHLLCRYWVNLFQWAIVPGEEHQMLPR